MNMPEENSVNSTVRDKETTDTPGSIGESYGSDFSQDSSDSSDSSDSDSDEEIPSLSDSILNEIQAGNYSCLVCTLELDNTSKVWSCPHCYRVYDLDCISDWAKRGTSTTSDRQWRCPNCNYSHKKVPKKFTCWCGKVENPAPGLVPFSCGNLCGHKYDECVHSCSAICHPASHPICGAMGPKMNCDCGKFEKQLPCLITPYKQGWKCDELCNLEICDLGHQCSRVCHLGFCGPCEETITGKCYCGKNELSIKCLEKYLQQADTYVGISYCEEQTKAYFQCGVHFEMLDCQVQTPPKPCKLSPEFQTTCYCGKTESHEPRSKCTDPIIECENVCGKELECGCQCKLKCHSGPCECFSLKTVKCSCRNYEFLVPCKALEQGFQPKCHHKCDALLNCRKHYHKEQCCKYEPIALARERNVKKAIRNRTVSSITSHSDIMELEPVHICYRNCNRTKSCGEHPCESLCHAGPCPPCLESSNEDLVCNCGKTVVPAPVRCGTKITCNEQCIRPKDCGHAPEPHKCHEDDTQCPKCTALVEKECECGRSVISLVLCSGNRPKCSHICQERRDCGHLCLRACSTQCDQGVHLSSSMCQGTCGKIRTNCPHKCKQRCHVNKVGKSPNCDARVCSELVNVSCECGRINKKVPCNASIDRPSVIETQLHCDDSCLKAKRDEELKQAFMESSPEKPEDAEPELLYSDYVLNTYRKQTRWCSNIELFLIKFMLDDKKSHHFHVMLTPQRQFVHELAAAYKLYSESQDPEPKRNVFIFKTSSSSQPSHNITDEIKIVDELKEKQRQEELAYQEKLQQELFNCILIQDIFLGVSEEEVVEKLQPLLEEKDLKCSPIKVQNYLAFLYTEEMSIEVENKLYLVMKYLKNWLRDSNLAFDCKLGLVRDGEMMKTDSKVVREQKSEKLNNKVNPFDLLHDEEQDQEQEDPEENGEQNEEEEENPEEQDKRQENIELDLEDAEDQT